MTFQEKKQPQSLLVQLQGNSRKIRISFDLITHTKTTARLAERHTQKGFLRHDFLTQVFFNLCRITEDLPEITIGGKPHKQNQQKTHNKPNKSKPKTKQKTTTISQQINYSRLLKIPSEIWKLRLINLGSYPNTVTRPRSKCKACSDKVVQELWSPRSDGEFQPLSLADIRQLKPSKSKSLELFSNQKPSGSLVVAEGLGKELHRLHTQAFLYILLPPVNCLLDVVSDGQQEELHISWEGDLMMKLWRQEAIGVLLFEQTFTA